jgi:hypothetical protein
MLTQDQSDHLRCSVQTAIENIIPTAISRNIKVASVSFYEVHDDIALEHWFKYDERKQVQP